MKYENKEESSFKEDVDFLFFNEETTTNQIKSENLSFSVLDKFIEAVSGAPTSFIRLGKNGDNIDKIFPDQDLLNNIDKNGYMLVPVEYKNNKFFMLNITKVDNEYKISISDSNPENGDSIDARNLVVRKLKSKLNRAKFINFLKTEKKKGNLTGPVQEILEKVEKYKNSIEFVKYYDELTKSIRDDIEDYNTKKETYKKTSKISKEKFKPTQKMLDSIKLHSVLDRFEFNATDTLNDRYRHSDSKDTGVFTLFNWFLLRNINMDNAINTEFNNTGPVYLDLSKFREVILSKLLDVKNGTLNTDIDSKFNAIMESNKQYARVKNPLIKRIRFKVSSFIRSVRNFSINLFTNIKKTINNTTIYLNKSLFGRGSLQNIDNNSVYFKNQEEIQNSIIFKKGSDISDNNSNNIKVINPNNNVKDIDPHKKNKPWHLGII